MIFLALLGRRKRRPASKNFWVSASDFFLMEGEIGKIIQYTIIQEPDGGELILLPPPSVIGFREGRGVG